MRQKQHSRRAGRNSRIKGIIIILLVLLAFAVAAAVWLDAHYLPFRGILINRKLEQIDLRGYELITEEYESLQAEIPDCRIIWNITIGGHKYSSDAEHITISSVETDEFPMFTLFENLREITAADARCYETLQELEAYLPDCEIHWGVHLNSAIYPITADSLDLTGTGVEAEELMTELSWFADLKQVQILDDTFSAEQKTALVSQYPGVIFTWNVEAAGKTWMSTDTRLDYAGQAVDVDALVSAADRFYAVEEIDLTGCGCTTDELIALHEAFGQPVIHSELTLWDKSFTTDETYLDYSGMRITDTSELEKIVPLMHSLEKVDMCDCGISNEEMDALNKRHEGVQFVWRVSFSVYSLRTDATFFCASDLPWNGYVAIKMNDQQLEPLKYCTELIALDLGHMYYTDLSFLENMPKLKYLILVDAQFHDITPIGTLKDLIYLEIFVNTIDDLTPLLNCTNLKHLNIGYTKGFDTEVLKQMTQLERLWYPGNKMSSEEVQELIAALPNTKCHLPSGDPKGSTGAGWREADIYYEMRNIFNMHYMPGGTGMNP